MKLSFRELQTIQAALAKRVKEMDHTANELNRAGIAIAASYARVELVKAIDLLAKVNYTLYQMERGE